MQDLMPRFGAGLWHFGQFRDRYATDGYGPPVSTLEAIKIAGSVQDLSVVDLLYPFSPPDLELGEVSEALRAAGLSAIAVTPEIYTRRFGRGGFTNPDAEVRRAAVGLVSAAADAGRQLGCDYIKIWPGQDGWDYPFQVSYRQIWRYSVDAMRELAQRHPDLRFAIEYKPREPRNRMTFSSMARTLLAIEEMGAENVGVLLDFGHSLYGGESPAEAAQMAIDRGKLFAIDVNDNFRGWDDDMVVGSVHLIETLEFFHTLQRNDWTGVWQLDQFPFRENSADAARAGIEVMQALWRTLRVIDEEKLRAAQEAQDALAAQRIIRKALLAADG
jgi:xylose isomerase